MCHEFADCTNTEGSYTCKCKEGYTGNGQECSEGRVASKQEKMTEQRGKLRALAGICHVPSFSLGLREHDFHLRSSNPEHGQLGFHRTGVLSY